MLVYSGIKTDFLRSVEDDTIADEIKQTTVGVLTITDEVTFATNEGA